MTRPYKRIFYLKLSHTKSARIDAAYVTSVAELARRLNNYDHCEHKGYSQRIPLNLKGRIIKPPRQLAVVIASSASDYHLCWKKGVNLPQV